MNSNNCFQTQVWGTPGWVFLHCIAFNFPLVPTRKQKADYIRFFKSIGDVFVTDEVSPSLVEQVLVGWNEET